MSNLFCPYCDKICKNNNSLAQHRIRCAKNPDRISINDFSKMYSSYSDEVKQRMSWNKGLTKETSESVKLCADKLIGKPGHMLGKTYVKSAESKQKQSITRKQRIFEGKIIPNANNRYVKSFIEYADGSRKMLRSSYELILSIFLNICGIEFQYEDVRVPYIDGDGNKRTFISDFRVGNTVIEVKGKCDDDKLSTERITFEENGYMFNVIYHKDIQRISNLLSEIMDIKSIIDNAKILSNSKQYFVYKLNF